MNPETSLCWHPLQEGLNLLRRDCLREATPPPHWDRVENLVGSGYPDLSWAWVLGGFSAEGHIELKYRAAPPVGPETPVVVESITPHQRLWWRQRWEAGGNIFVLLRLSQEYMLFQGNWAAFNLGTTTVSGLREHASKIVALPKVKTADGAAQILEASCR